jgi:hypothetical protein
MLVSIWSSEQALRMGAINAEPVRHSNSNFRQINIPANPACTFCKSSTKRSPTDCYNSREAEILSHIFSVDDGADKFSCTPNSN